MNHSETFKEIERTWILHKMLLWPWHLTYWPLNWSGSSTDHDHLFYKKMTISHKLFKIVSGHGLCIKCYCDINIWPSDLVATTMQFAVDNLLFPVFSSTTFSRTNKKLMKGKALRKHSLHEKKTAASVLLKLFISSNEWSHTTDAPLAHERNSIFKCKQHTCTLFDHGGPEKYNYKMM